MFISNSGVAFSPKLLSLRGEWGVEIGIASETKFLSFIDLEKWPMYQKRYSTFSFGQDRSKKKFQIYGWMWIVNNGCHSKCNPEEQKRIFLGVTMYTPTQKRRVKNAKDSYIKIWSRLPNFLKNCVIPSQPYKLQIDFLLLYQIYW